MSEVLRLDPVERAITDIAAAVAAELDAAYPAISWRNTADKLKAG